MSIQTTEHTPLGYMFSEWGPHTFEMMFSVILWFFLALQKAKEEGGGILERC